MEVIKNSKETFVRLQQLIWNGGTDRQTDRQTDTQTDRQTDPCIELRYAQLNMDLSVNFLLKFGWDLTNISQVHLHQPHGSCARGWEVYAAARLRGCPRLGAVSELVLRERVPVLVAGHRLCRGEENMKHLQDWLLWLNCTRYRCTGCTRARPSGGRISPSVGTRRRRSGWRAPTVWMTWSLRCLTRSELGVWVLDAKTQLTIHTAKIFLNGEV